MSPTTEATTAITIEPAGSAEPFRPIPTAALARRVRGVPTAVGLALGGFAVLALIWYLAASTSDLPAPGETLSRLWTLVSNPFYDNGPNDRGIGLQLLSSLGRVFSGFGLAVAIGVPLGALIGASRLAYRMANPVVQMLRPVSPLAWFPIGLVVFQAASTASVFVIFITAIWPIVINTAFGVGSVRQDHRDVAQVFRFSRWTYIRRVLLPHSLPAIITGLRLSMGIAWLVIVAVEMLSGGQGIGFFVWDAYNASNMENVMAAIFLIGAIGLLLDTAFTRLGRRFDHETREA